MSLHSRDSRLYLDVGKLERWKGPAMIDNSEKMLYESERLYQTLIHSMNEGLAVCEIILDESDVAYPIRP